MATDDTKTPQQQPPPDPDRTERELRFPAPEDCTLGRGKLRTTDGPGSYETTSTPASDRDRAR